MSMIRTMSVSLSHARSCERAGEGGQVEVATVDGLGRIPGVGSVVHVIRVGPEEAVALQSRGVDVVMDSPIFEEHPLTVLSSIVHRMSSMSSMRSPMRKITILGSDLAKNVFQLHGVDAQGYVVVRKRVF
jgi:hypothetical protein